MLKKCFIFFMFLCAHYAQALDLQTVEIIALLEGKNYKTAVRLLEKAIRLEHNKAKKGHYALLLNQIPANVHTQRPRYEYAHIAVRWANNIPESKKILLWIEAGDGFFHTGLLRQGEQCYQKAIELINRQKNRSKLVYVQHKRAWIYVNQKKWKKAFYLLASTTASPGRLKRNIFFDLGKVWSESQSFVNRAPLSGLQNIMKTASRSEKKIIVDGLIQGMIRSLNMNSVISVLSENTKLSFRVLNKVLSSDKADMFSACAFLPWLNNHFNSFRQLNSEEVLPILNRCTKNLTTKENNKNHRPQLKSLVKFYNVLELTGVQRWPLILVYEQLAWKKQACGESIKQMIETAKEMLSAKDKDIEKCTAIASRLCSGVKIHSPLADSLLSTLLSSKSLALKYKHIKEDFENNLFHLLKSSSFHPLLKKHILEVNKKSQWMKKDLFPALTLLNVQDYNSKELKLFLKKWASTPLEGVYLDIVRTKRNDFLNVKELSKWLPLSSRDSYTALIPWIKKSLSSKLAPRKQRMLVDKVLKYFPTQKKDKKKAAVFLALHFFNTGELKEIFANWQKLKPAFSDKSLAVELFEKSLHQANKYCPALKSLSFHTRSLPAFIHQSCSLLQGRRRAVYKLKVPVVLHSSHLAWDLAILRQTHNKTLRLKKGISRLENKTEKMIISLRDSVVNVHKRRWRSSKAQTKCQNLIQEQIVLFQNELKKLSKSSPYGDKYTKLAKALDQWR